MVNLPQYLAEIVFEYLPLPRVWEWSLSRLQLRCHLSPVQAMHDISTLIDEILCDANIILGPNQKQLLFRIKQTPHVCLFNFPVI